MVDIVVDFGGTFLNRTGTNKDIIQLTDNRFVAVGIDTSNVLRAAIIDFTDFKTSDAYTVTIVKVLSNTGNDDIEQVYVQKLSSSKAVVFHGTAYIVLDIQLNDIVEIISSVLPFLGTTSVNSNAFLNTDAPHATSFFTKYIRDNVICFIDERNISGNYWSNTYTLTFNTSNNTVNITAELSNAVYTRSISIPKIYNIEVIDDNNFIVNQLGYTSTNVVNYISYNIDRCELFYYDNLAWQVRSISPPVNETMNISYNSSNNEIYFLLDLAEIYRGVLDSRIEPVYTLVNEPAFNQVISGSNNFFANNQTRISNFLNLDDVYYLVGYYNTRLSGSLWNAGYTMLKRMDNRWYQIEDYNNPSIGNIILKREAFIKFSNELVTFYGYIDQNGSEMTFPIQRIYAPNI